MKNRNRTALGFTLACAVAMTGIGGSAAIAVDPLPAPASSKVQPQPSEIPHLTESELKDIGLTRSDAEQATDSFAEVIDSAEKTGEISSAEAQALRGNLLAQNDSGEGVQPQALPLWAAAAIVGCAGSVALGEGKTQVKNALKSGSSVDQATDIAIGVGVDCVFGAVPLGAIGAVAKKAVTTPIKNALRPLVKKVVQKINKDL